MSSFVKKIFEHAYLVRIAEIKCILSICKLFISIINQTLLTFQTLNYNYLYALNCWILVNPWWLCFDWSMGSVPTIDSVSDPRVLAVIVLWVVLAFCLYSACVGPIGQQQR